MLLPFPMTPDGYFVMLNPVGLNLPTDPFTNLWKGFSLPQIGANPYGTP
jgi:hypothetical protein